MNCNVWRSVFAAIVFMMCLSGLTIAQEITGSIVGTVRDASGAVVPGATITLIDPAKNNTVVRTATTNDDGGYSIPNIPVSSYSVTVESPNFKKSITTDVKVDVGQRRTVDLTLEAGSISETVTVEADRVAVESTTPQASTTINGDQVRELSLNNRNFVQLVTLAPGVSNDLSDQIYTGTTAVGFENGNSATSAQSSQPNTVQISVNGARSSQNTFTVDGADITDRGSNITIQAYPSVDSIGEFRVLRSLYPAESGRSGGGQVNVVTRSGGKDFHGDVFGFVRNEVFNANDFFGNQIAPAGRDSDGKAKRKPFRYINYGWTIGGPVYFFNFGENDGGMFRRYDKTFFFYSQEFRRDRRSPTLFSTVPTGLMRQGSFSAPVCIQASGSTCTTILPANTPITTLQPINPVAQQYLDYIFTKIPLPNSPTGIFTLNFPTPNEADFRQEIIKIDHSFTDKWSAYYRFQNDTIPTRDANAIFSSGSGIPFVSTTETESPGRTHTFQSTYVISPNIIVEGRYNFGYGAIKSHNVGLAALVNSPIQPPMPYINVRDRVPSLTFATGTLNPISSFGPYDNFSWKGNIGGNVTWIIGNHTTKYGLVYSKYRKNENAIAGNNEGLFSGFNTPGSTGSVVPAGGSATQQQFANFLLGTNVTFSQAKFDYTADLRQKAFEAFAQDEWRVGNNLTVYYGVRYSFFGSPWDKNGRLANFDPAFWSASQAPAVTGSGIRVVGTGNFCNGIIINTQNPQSLPNCSPTASPFGKFVSKVSKTDFAPRVGLAWDPFGKGETAIRTGYGIYHEQVLNGTFLQNIGTNSPYQQNCTLTGVRLDSPDPANTCNSPAFGFGVAQSVRAVDPDWQTPYMQHWSLDIQQQLTKKTIVTVGYYGSKGTNLIGSFELNEIAPGRALQSTCATGSTYIGGPNPNLAPCQAPGQVFTTAASALILDQIRPYRGYRSIAMVKPVFNSSYHSMQVSGQHRFSGASQVNLAYTWSKNLTDNQNDRSASPQNIYDINSDRGRAALDRRHILTVNFIYEIPFMRDQKGIVGKILGGWQASGIVGYSTGLPFTVTTSSLDPAGLGIASPPTTVARPNMLCDPNQGAPHTAAQWFNTNCFQTNAAAIASGANTVGNAPRGIIEGPSTRRVDFTLSKNIRFTESVWVQLRAEAFNIFNWTNFRSLSTNVTSSTFGQVISTRDPRTMQFGAKLYF